MNKFLPEALYELGFTDLVSVIPPSAVLTPTSKISPAAIGKIPGRRLPTGLWAGYDWRAAQHTLADVKQWNLDGANVGLKADRFPAVDIDCTDAALAQIIKDAAFAKLGHAPVRTGKAPKQLLMYGLSGEPFGRMRLFIKRGEVEHLVEILAQGQQYIVHGVHPGTLRAYEWNEEIPRTWCESHAITREQASKFLTYLEETLGMLGWITKRQGDGALVTHVLGEQKGLEAPSLEVLRDAIRTIPNNNDLFPARDDYVKMGYAIKAAAGIDEEEGFNIFAEWAMKWEGNGRSAGNDPNVVREDWRRFRGPFAVGWSFLAEQARAFGFSDAELDFDASGEARRADAELPAVSFSDQWLAEKIVSRQRGRLRYVPEKGCWLVWSEGKWQIDAELLAEDIVKRELKVIADEVARIGATPKEKKEMTTVAISILSAGKVTAVSSLVRSDRSVAVSMESLDKDIWLLNTPGGVVDLRTGDLMPHDPDLLCSKSTSVPPDFSGDCPRWKQFLMEATNNAATIGYLQRLCGYALTGSTKEEQLTFVSGPGGNGKSKFLGVLAGIFGGYATNASMDTFTASQHEKHSTDMAMLAGARLVTASETRAGRRWDEQRVKSLTGGDRVTARFMHKNNFTFKPQLKLIFVGNHKPELRDVDEAMKRRLHMVPFTIKPKVIDQELDLKLEAEWPAILAWMIDGCLAWQQTGLVPPEQVKLSTEEYFSEEDGFGRWIAESISVEGDSTASSAELFESWSEWANANGEWVGSLKRLSSALISRGFARTKDSKTRRKGFAGLRVVNRQELGIAL